MKSILRCVAAIAVTFVAPFAFAGPDWINITNDPSWDNPNNWTSETSSGVLPGPGDSAHIFPGFTTSADITDITVTPGGLINVTVQTATDHTISSLLVSSNFDSNTVTGGVLNLNFGGGSTLTLDSAGALLSGGTVVNFSGNLTMPTGTFTIGTSAADQPSELDPGQVTGGATLNFSSGTMNLDGINSSLVLGHAGVGNVTGIFNQSGSAVVNLGADTEIGQNIGGTGTYNLSGNAVLNVGGSTPASGSYFLVIGSGGTSVGTMSLSGNAQLNAINDGTLIIVGDSTSTTESSLSQTDSSVVNIGQAGSTVSLVLGASGTGTYYLKGGTLNLSSASVYIGEGGTGQLIQTGGTLNSDSATSFLIGTAGGGTGLYSISGGTATFNDSIFVGGSPVGTGTLQVSGGTLTANNAINVGGAAGMSAGTMTISGGSVVMNSALDVNATGTVNQNGGTLNVVSGQAINIAAGGQYNLNGGVLQIGGNNSVAGAGNFNYGGGTLEVTDTLFTSSLSGTVTGQSVIKADLASTDIILSGSLSGSGGLTLQGNGDTFFYLAGPVSYSGLTSVSGGTLDLDMNTFTGTGGLSIASDSTVNLLPSGGTDVLNGAIQGSGVLNTYENMELAGTGNFSGTINVGSGGSLMLFNGSFGTVNATGADVLIGGDSTIRTSGSVTLASLTSDSLTIASNFSLNSPSIQSGAITIQSQATLTSDSIAANSIDNQGTLVTKGISELGATPVDITNSGNIISGLTLPTLATNAPLNPVTVTIQGDLSGPGSLTIRLNGSSYDRFAFHDVTFNGGPLIVTGSANLGQHTYTKVVSADDPIVGLPTVGPGTALLEINSAVLSGDGMGIDLTITQKAIASYAQTPNQRSVATAIDNTGSNVLKDRFNALTIAQAPSVIPPALDQLSPQSLQYTSMIAFENSTFLVQKVNGALANIRAGYAGLDGSGIGYITPGMDGALGRQMNTLLASNNQPFHSAAPNGVNYYPDTETPSGNPNAPSPRVYDPSPFAGTESSGPISDSPMPLHTSSSPTLRAPAFSEFIGGDVVLADLNQDNSLANAPSSKASYTAGDVIAGVSLRVTSNLSLGVLFDYNHTNATTDSYGSKTTVDSYMPGLFATYTYKDFFVNGLFAFGYNTYSNSRVIPFTGGTGTSSPTGQQYVGNLDFGYNLYPAKGLVVTPTLGLTYVHLDVDGFTESGGNGGDLTVDSQHTDSLRSRLGGQVAYFIHAGSITFQPNVSAMWQHEYLNDSTGITSSLSDIGSSPFTIQTANPNRDSALLGAGVTATLDNGMAFYLNYMADAGASSYFAQTVFGGFKAKF